MRSRRPVRPAEMGKKTDTKSILIRLIFTGIGTIRSLIKDICLK